MWPALPLLVEFVPGSRLEKEPELAPHANGLPIVGNGPPGTFVRFADGRRIRCPPIRSSSARSARAWRRSASAACASSMEADCRRTYAAAASLRPRARRMFQLRGATRRSPQQQAAASSGEGRHTGPIGHCGKPTHLCGFRGSAALLGEGQGRLGGRRVVVLSVALPRAPRRACAPRPRRWECWRRPRSPPRFRFACPNPPCRSPADLSSR